MANLIDIKIKIINNKLLIAQEKIIWLKKETSATQKQIWDLKSEKKRLLNNDKYEPEEPAEWGARRTDILNIVRR